MSHNQNNARCENSWDIHLLHVVGCVKRCHAYMSYKKPMRFNRSHSVVYVAYIVAVGTLATNGYAAIHTATPLNSDVTSTCDQDTRQDQNQYINLTTDQSEKQPQHQTQHQIQFQLLHQIQNKPQDADQDAGTNADDADDLADRLLQQSRGDNDDDIMLRILRLMSESGNRLNLKFDTGEQTQAVQNRIMKELDDAIKAAAKNQQKKSSGQQQSQADTRKQGDPTAKPDSEQSDQSESNTTAQQTSESTQSGSVTSDNTSTTGAMLDRRRGWGNLPQRDREEIIQSYGEKMLERYQSWIEQYYRALQHEDDEIEQQ